MMHTIRKILLKVAVKFITNSNDEEILEITNAVITRYKNKFPGWEVTFLSFPADPAKREDTLMRIIEFYRNHPKM